MTYPMSHDTVFGPPKASAGVHEQIESFLETVMRGVMGPHDQQTAAEQVGKQGRPVVLQSVSTGDYYCRCGQLFKSKRAIFLLFNGVRFSDHLELQMSRQKR